MQNKINIARSLQRQLEKRLKEISSLYEVNLIINSTLDLDEVLRLITKKVASITRAKACSLRLIDDLRRNELVLRSYCGPSKKSYLLKGSIKLGKSIAGRVALQKKPLVIDDLKACDFYLFKPFAKKEGVRSLICVPLLKEGKCIGVLSVYYEHQHHYTKNDVYILSLFASQATVAINNARIFNYIHLNCLRLIKVLTNTIAIKDNYTRRHSHKVAENALKIAEVLELSEQDKEALRFAAYLHDLGKIAIDNYILRKPDKLSVDEWKQVVKHPAIGARIVKESGMLELLAPIIYYHHAKYSGGGYPDSKIKKDDIPIGARILAVADAYEAMRSNRPYRKALTKSQAKNELKRCAGVQFDPNIVNIFLKIIK